MPAPLIGGGIKRWCCLTSVCLSDHVTRDSDSTFKVKRLLTRSPGRCTHRGVNASGSNSGDRRNVLTVGTYCYTLRSTGAVGSALRRPQREERGGGILWRPPAYSLLSLKWTARSINSTHSLCRVEQCFSLSSGAVVSCHCIAYWFSSRISVRLHGARCCYVNSVRPVPVCCVETITRILKLFHIW